MSGTAADRDAAREHAIAAYRAGDWVEAPRRLADLARRSPKDPVVLRYLGLAMVRSGRAGEALPLLARACALAPDNAEALLAHGIGLQATGDCAAAAVLFRRCLALLPADPAPALNLATALLAAGDVAGAHAAARKARLRAPSRSEVHYTLGLVALATGALAEAAAGFDRAAALDPAYAEAWVNLGAVRLRQGDFAAAREATRQAIALSPGHRGAAANLAILDQAIDQHDQPLQDALAQDPGNPQARLNVAIAMLADGRLEESLDLLQTHRPQDTRLRPRWTMQQAIIQLRLGRHADAALTIEDIGPIPAELIPLRHWYDVNAAAAADLPAARRHARAMEQALAALPSMAMDLAIDGWFDIAGFWRTQNEPDADIAACVAGHRLLRRNQPFSRPVVAAHLAATTSCFDHDRIACGPSASNADPAPVFVVGMPRSGTTLAERILAAHPLVHGAGERAALGRTASRFGAPWDASTPRRLAGLDRDRLDREAAGYLDDLHALNPSASRVVDKMPSNLRLLGFAALLLPKARFICCDRDPRDVGLSIFQHRFLGAHAYAHDLADLGWFIAGMQRLAQHWRSVLRERLLVVTLRSWVEDFDGTLRRVLEFLDLPYHDACTRFHEHGPRVQSLSRDQVRVPVNAQGLDRWKPYARSLQPMIAALGEAAHNHQLIR